MRILVTNDDGIDAYGLQVLSEIARTISDDVWIVAPHEDNSGASHAITLKDPLRARKIDEKTFALTGTPTDCVIMGVRQFLGEKAPDLILSGINHGQNIADDVTYSGTIAGAMEGTLSQIPSIALSLVTGMKAPGSTQWDTAKALGKTLVPQLLQSGWPKDVLLNINFPDCALEDVQGTMVTVQGRRDQSFLSIDERNDTRGGQYYWFDFERRRSNPPKGTDLWAAYNNYTSVTPLHLDLTHHASCEQLKSALGSV